MTNHKWERIRVYDHFGFQPSEAWSTSEDIKAMLADGTLKPCIAEIRCVVLHEDDLFLYVGSMAEVGGPYASDPGFNLLEGVLKSAIISREVCQ